MAVSFISVIIGLIIKYVRNKDNAINTWLGGAVWVFKAALVKCRTIMILVKDVKQIMRIGANAIPVRINITLRGPAIDPFPSFKLTVTLFAIFNSPNSSASSELPGSRILVLSSSSPASPEEVRALSNPPA